MVIDLNRHESTTVLTTASPLVLASASPRRSEILCSLGFQFEIAPADIDEEALVGVEPVRLAIELAEKKARVVRSGRPCSCVIAADTVVEIDGVSVGKPSNSAEAASMLRSLSGRTHRVHTGVAVMMDDVLTSDVETTHVTMRELTQPEIKAYVSTGAAMDKAGAYGIQDTKFSPVASYEGSYLNVVGLPVRLLARLLLEAGQIDPSVAHEISEIDSI